MSDLSPDAELHDRLDRLERRLTRVEVRLGLPPEAARVISPDAPVAAPPALPAAGPPTAPPTSPVAVAERPLAPLAEVVHRIAHAPVASVPPTAPHPTSIARPGHPRIPVAPPARAPKTKNQLELAIGGKWAAWLGALVTVLGAAFLVKHGLVEGWWGHISPGVRSLLVAAFGGALIACGEIALRKVSKPASVGLFGAGLGVLYLDAYSASTILDLFAPEWAFVLMALVALGGFAITLRTRFQTIGVLSLVGGYLVPILLFTTRGHDLELLSYLTLLLGVALALALARPVEFHVLRVVALGGQCIVGLWWLIPQGKAEWILAVIFMSIWWSFFLAQSLVSAMRGHTPRANAVITLLATAAFATAGTWIIRSSTPPGGTDWLGLFVGATGVLGVAAAYQFTGIEALRRRPRDAMDRLAIALWAQGAVLLVTATALQFDGFAQSIGWLAIALAAIEIGRRLPSRGVDVFGLIVGALALGHVLFARYFVPELEDVLSTRLGAVITEWAILALIAIAVVHTAARRFRAGLSSGWQAMPPLLAGLGTLLWLGLAAAQCEGLTTTAAWLAGAVILLATERFGRRERYLDIALAVLAVTAARWLAIDAIGARFEPGWQAGAMTPVFNMQMGLALALTACGWWATRRLQARAREMASTLPRASAGAPDRVLAAELVWTIAFVLALLFVLTAMTFEVDRLVTAMGRADRAIAWSVHHVRQLATTVLWAVGSAGFGLLAAAVCPPAAKDRANAARIVLNVGFSVLAIVALKWVVIDTLSFTMLSARPAALALAAIGNLQMVAAISIAAAGLVLLFAARNRSIGGSAAPSSLSMLITIAPIASVCILLWGLSFEIDRIVARLSPETLRSLAVGAGELRALGVAALWGAGGLATTITGRVRRSAPLTVGGWWLLSLSTPLWLATTLNAHLYGETAGLVVLNIESAVGALLLAGHVLTSWKPGESDAKQRRGVSLAFALVLGLWLGNIEIDRALEEPMAVQAGLSVWWGLYGVGLVVGGFAWRMAAARYAGLALLAITVGKVALVDLSTVDRLWRVVSFIVSGLLLVGTSVLYGKLSPRLLGAQGANRPDADADGAGDRSI